MVFNYFLWLCEKVHILLQLSKLFYCISVNWISKFLSESLRIIPNNKRIEYQLKIRTDEHYYIPQIKVSFHLEVSWENFNGGRVNPFRYLFDANLLHLIRFNWIYDLISLKKQQQTGDNGWIALSGQVNQLQKIWFWNWTAQNIV